LQQFSPTPQQFPPHTRFASSQHTLPLTHTPDGQHESPHISSGLQHDLLPGAQIWPAPQHTPSQATVAVAQQRFACGSMHWWPGAQYKDCCGDVGVLQQAAPGGAQ